MGAHPITRISARAFTIPTDQAESDGTLAWHETTIIVVVIHAGGHTGLGYTYAHAVVSTLINETLSPLLLDQDCFGIAECRRRLVHAVRNLGCTGLAAMAISACDTALWDLKARILGLPLIALLGPCRSSCPIYGSGGFTSYDDHRLREQMQGWAESGLSMVKMKVGRDPRLDGHRVRTVRDAIGPEVGLFVDANGAYQPSQALVMAQAFLEADVRWFEEPVPSQDTTRMRWVRERVPPGMEVAGGEYQFTLTDAEATLAAQAVHVLQADATRCQGISGFMDTAALCAAHGIELSSHCAPAIHLHLGCALAVVRHLEWFHDHVRIEALCFDGMQEPVAGRLGPDSSAPGLGLTFKERDMERYRV